MKPAVDIESNNTRNQDIQITLIRKRTSLHNEEDNEIKTSKQIVIGRNRKQKFQLCTL